MEAFCIGINPDFESTGKLFEIGTINLDGIGALIIGPNMQARKADLLKVIDVLECLSGHMDCAVISGTPFVAFFYKGRTVKLQENEYIRGAMIVFKLTEYGIELLHDEDYKAALSSTFLMLLWEQSLQISVKHSVLHQVQMPQKRYRAWCWMDASEQHFQILCRV